MNNLEIIKRKAHLIRIMNIETTLQVIAVLNYIYQIWVLPFQKEKSKKNSNDLGMLLITHLNEKVENQLIISDML